MSEAREIYPLPRDENESNRLNEQHYFITEIIEGPIVKAVPRTNLFAFADVGTGTGIWLKEILESMKHMPAACPRYYHGFDISDAQFPSTPEEIDFTVQDVTRPLPLQHQSRYDLVHVRMLVGAIKVSDFKTVLANLITLLKPGGYLQWVEFDIITLLEGNGAEYPKFAELLQPYYSFATANGLSLCASKAIYTACKEAGLVNVARYCPTILDHLDLEERFQIWLLASFKSIMPRIFLRTGTVATEDAAKQLASHWLSELGELLAEGLKPGTTFGTVVAQKPNDSGGALGYHSE
ncbi:hypothetical protein N7532_004827 [Penicillium argentinense]|uniref:Methyltransferase domain-containing protein n=1 Tax=Penicillium argentinense TaxID=1131581 RepID=A0A9W9FCY2_9EURO|nr:uncharacterized protein N7532_004827 [Penicillium argentinense]KAJ5097826.1 hypothetical protein N7532_004827 [Penicillium argentinense]